jgi:hypothetical protein
MVMLGAAFETETDSVVTGFAMAAVERFGQGRTLTCCEAKFIKALFIPFLRQCMGDEEEKLALQAELLLS